MKRKALNELKTQNIGDLKKKIADLEKEVANEQIELKMGKSKNVHAVKNKKKDIARIKTILVMQNIKSKSSNSHVKLIKEKKESANAAN